jgi:hypothetical protein
LVILYGLGPIIPTIPSFAKIKIERVKVNPKRGLLEP